MGTLKTLFVLIISTFALHTNANDTVLNYQLHKTIVGNFTNFSLDNLGNVYLVSANNQIKKLNQNFDSVGVFNDVRRFGKISLVDATNPLKILVYYKDFATVLILDRFLNIRSTIDLRSQNVLQVQSIALSYDNQIWLFDELDARIKKVDETGKVLLSSADFRMLYDEVPNPTTLIDANGLLHLYNPKYGWLLFDYYGAQKNKYAMLNWQDVQLVNNTLMGRTKNTIHIAQPQTLSIKDYSTNIDLSTAKKVVHHQSKMFVLFEDRLAVYQSK